VPGGANICSVLIVNNLLKILDAENYQNAGNAVLEYATSTRSLGGIEFAFGHISTHPIPIPARIQTPTCFVCYIPYHLSVPH